MGFALFMTRTRCGISARQLEREIGATCKTAWRMAHLSRHELMEQSDEPLSGEVELDGVNVYAGRNSERNSGLSIFDLLLRRAVGS